MATAKKPIGEYIGQELVITRIIDAPREMVFDAWKDPDQVKQWWGPKDFTAPFAEIDFRVGGKSLSCMRSPESKEYWGVGVYQEIVPPERIVSTDSFADEKGNVVPATYYGMSPDFPLELLITVTFEDIDGKTKLTLHHAGFPDEENLDMAREGWSESLDKLANYLENEIEDEE